MLALVGAQQLAERRVDRVAPQRRLVGREQPLLAGEQVLEQLGVRAPGHQSAPVTNGPSAAGSPWSTRAVARWPASSLQMPAASLAKLGVGQVGHRLEVGAHLALLEVLGEPERVGGRPEPREGARVLLGAAAGRRLAAEIGDQLLQPGRVAALLRADRVHLLARLAAQNLQAGAVCRERGALERQERAEQRGARARPRAGGRRRVAAPARGEDERGRGAAERLAPRDGGRHAAAD